MRDFGVRFERVPLMCNNTSAISVAKNPVFHKKMRHVGRRHHFLRDHVEKGDIETCFVTFWISLGWSTLTLSGEILSQMFSS
jgi:hypothetical protein